jgi:hypothetical protein
MGLIKELVLLPVAPFRLTVWVTERIADEAERQRYSPGAAISQMEELERAREHSEIDEGEAAEREEQILKEQVVRS